MTKPALEMKLPLAGDPSAASPLRSISDSVDVAFCRPGLAPCRAGCGSGSVGLSLGRRTSGAREHAASAGRALELVGNAAAHQVAQRIHRLVGDVAVDGRAPAFPPDQPLLREEGQ